MCFQINLNIKCAIIIFQTYVASIIWHQYTPNMSRKSNITNDIDLTELSVYIFKSYIKKVVHRKPNPTVLLPILAMHLFSQLI